MPAGNDTVVVRKLAVDYLAHELDSRESEAHLVGEKIDGQLRLAVFEKLAELEHGLARQNDLLLRVISRNGDARVRKTVPVGRHCLQRALVDHQKHAVQVVTDVLLRHRELGELEQSTEIALR